MMNTQDLKNWWEKWDIQFVVTASLILQIYLIFGAPLRKRMSKWFITMPMWLAYLLADAAATYAVGLISKSQIQSKKPPNADILVFWAPFLLVHLGGPDTITAFALEDNELWLRHALSLVVQSLAVAYAFYLSFRDSKFWLPSVLIFLVGLIKYTERTRSLYLASTRRFRQSLLTKPDPGPNYAKLMDEYSSKIEAGLPTRIDLIPEPNRVNKVVNKEDFEPLTDLQIVQRGHKYFSTFKGLIADLIFSFRERSVCREYFIKRSSRDAFKIVEVELNFIYEILYTKVTVVQGNYGYPLRVLSFGLSCAALLLFHYTHKPRPKYHRYDIVLSYTLLGGALALDTVAFFMVLLSDWTAVVLSEPEGRYSDGNFFKQQLSNLKQFLSKPLRIERDRWPKEETNPTTGDIKIIEEPKKRSYHPFGWLTAIVRRRWSESIAQFNLVDYCLRPRPKILEFIIDLFGLTSMLDSVKYVVSKDYTIEIRDLLYGELKMKSDMAEDLDTAREIFSSRGDWVLRFESCTNLLPWIDSVDYDESILLWHIATELLYNTDGVEPSKPRTTNSTPNLKEGDYKRFSKLISDYMLYLLIMQTTMLTTVAGIGQIRFSDTCAETRKFFRGRNIGRRRGNCFSMLFCCFSCCCGSDLESGEGNQKTSCFGSLKNFFCCRKEEVNPDETRQARMHKYACERILAVRTAVKPVAVKGDRSKSILFDASMLAQALSKLGEEIMKENREQDEMNTNKKRRKGKWEIMCRVWIELLCYAATRCRASTHAAQLSKGGELITLIWLLMAHFGLGNQYQISEGHARAKLIVGK